MFNRRSIHLNYRKYLPGLVAFAIGVIFAVTVLLFGKNSGKHNKIEETIRTPVSTYDINNIEWIHEGENITHKQTPIKYLGAISQELKDMESSTTMDANIEYFVGDNSYFSKTGHIISNTGMYPKKADFLDKYCPSSSFTEADKIIAIGIPNCSDIQAFVYFSMLIKSIPESYLSSHQVYINRDFYESDKLFKNFPFITKPIIMSNDIFAKEILFFKYPEVYDIHTSAFHRAEEHIRNYVDNRAFTNKITILAGQGSSIAGVPEAKQALKKNSRFIERPLPASLFGRLEVLRKSDVIVSFGSDVAEFLPLCREGSIYIDVIGEGQITSEPLIAKSAGLKVYVLGAKNSRIDMKVIDCINEIVSREYPDESNPDLIPPEGEIKLEW